jgi:hypothetical protein
MMKPRALFHTSALLATMFVVVACDPYPPTFHPDYAIKITPTAKGGVATAPTCPSYATETANPYDNQPLPQFGCADARNLAAMVEHPNDLIHGRPMGEGRGTIAVGAIRRYDNNQPRGLLTPSAEFSQKAATTAPSDSSIMTGDITAGGSATSPTSGASSAP